MAAKLTLPFLAILFIACAKNPEPSTSATAPKPPEAPAETPKLEQKDDGPLVSSFKEQQIKLRIIDAVMVQKAVIDRARNVFANGRVDTMENLREEILDGATMCFLTVSSNTPTAGSTLSKDRILSVIRKTEKTHASGFRQLSFIFEEAAIGLACLKRGDQGFTLSDLRGAMKNAVEITIQNNRTQ